MIVGLLPAKRWAVLGLALLLALLDRALSFFLDIEGLLPEPAEGVVLIAWAIGHCDTLDGPVVAAARRALETGNVDHVLPWVGEEDEPDVRRAFEHALAVRELGPQARELADRHFFETLVRIHRLSEGAPFTGLRPAGADLGPAVPAADQALETGLVKSLVSLLTDAVRSGVHRQFQDAMAQKSFAVEDVAAGRRFVEAYERYIHYAERIWQAATEPGPAHLERAGGHADEHMQARRVH